MKMPVKILHVVLFAIIVCMVQRTNGCKDPNEFKPPEDTLENPPPAPVLLAPMDSFVYMAESEDHEYELIWEPVDRAELYQLEFTWVGVICDTIEVETTGYARSMHMTGYGVYQWRVRAGSPAWFFTGWSELRQFEVRWLPYPPKLCVPQQDDIIYLDPDSVRVQFLWRHQSDARSYEIMVNNDLYTIYQSEVADTTCTFDFWDPDMYYWQVRACSQNWERSTDWSPPQSFEVREHPGMR